MTPQEMKAWITGQEELYSIDINGKKAFNTDVLTVLIKRLERINYQKWVSDGIIKHSDIRFQLLVRIEMAVLHYYQGIVSSISSAEIIWNSTKYLGYTDEFVANSITFREVNLRTTFLEKVFFEIDYFIQRMNQHIAFHQSGSIHKKQQFFGMLINALSISNQNINTKSLVEELNGDIIIDYMKDIFNEVKGRNVSFVEIYSYLVSVRNSFHNNGYSQITLNKIDVGGVILEAQKGKQINQNHSVVTIVVYMILYPLLSIVEKTFLSHIGQYWEDPYTKEIEEFMEKRRLEREASGDTL